MENKQQKLRNYKIEIKEIEVFGVSADYFDLTINGDTWSCRTLNDCIEFIEDIIKDGK